jgi:predicted nuclease of predicted toxin-antitoxin system
MKFLIDMNLSPQWVSVFEDAGWEAQHWSFIGKPNAPDREIGALITIDEKKSRARILPLRK